ATATEPGAELARALLPSSDPDEVERRQARTAEAVALLEAAVEPSLNGIADMRPAAARAARGGSLDAHELRSIADTVSVALAARPVLAVKLSARGRGPGIVHDASSSGQTLFVEPLAVVELNNRLAEAASVEREEVERILAELSGLVGAHASALQIVVEAAADL